MNVTAPLPGSNSALHALSESWEALPHVMENVAGFPADVALASSRFSNDPDQLGNNVLGLPQELRGMIWKELVSVIQLPGKISVLLKLADQNLEFREAIGDRGRALASKSFLNNKFLDAMRVANWEDVEDLEDKVDMKGEAGEMALGLLGSVNTFDIVEKSPYAQYSSYQFDRELYYNSILPVWIDDPNTNISYALPIIALIRKLHKEGLDIKGEAGQKALLYAAKHKVPITTAYTYGQVPIFVAELKRAGLNITRELGEQALKLAIENKNDLMIGALNRVGADISKELLESNIISAANGRGIQNRYVVSAMLRFVHNSGSDSWRNGLWKKAINRAAKVGNSYFFEFMRDVGVRINKEDLAEALVISAQNEDRFRDQSGYAPLIYQLNLLGVYINTTVGKVGNEALLVAAKNGNESFIKTLSQPHYKLDMTGDVGKSALQIALDDKHKNIFNLLLDRGATLTAGQRLQAEWQWPGISLARAGKLIGQFVNEL